MTLALLLALFSNDEPRNPAHVRMGIYIINVGKFDLASGSYTIDFYLTVESDSELPPGYNTEKAADLSFEFINGRALKPLRLESIYMGCVSYSLKYFPDGRK